MPTVIPARCLSVVMPVFNEKDRALAVARLCLARPEVGELIIVDDASTDGTRPQLETLRDDDRVKLFFQDKNHGKGAAITLGFKHTTCRYVIVQDADFEYNPEDYPLVLEPLVSGKSDVVYGSRFMGTPGRVRYFRHEQGNKLLTFFSNCLSDLNLSDMETCYKAFRGEVIRNLRLCSPRFGIEVEITAKIARSRVLSVWQVPISYNPRNYQQGKKIGWKDGCAALWHIIRFNWFNTDEKSFFRPWNEVLDKNFEAEK